MTKPVTASENIGSGFGRSPDAKPLGELLAPTMTIELRKVTLNKALSDETACFHAQVWIDGQLAGDVSNRGHGGCHEYSTHALSERLETHAKTLPPIDISGYGLPGENTMPESGDGLIDKALTHWEVSRDYRRLIKSKVVVLSGDKVFTYGKKGVPLERVRAVIKVKDGDVVLSDLPEAEAIEKFKAAVVK